MKISKINPCLEDLQAYLKDIEHAGFGISRNLRDYLEQNFPGAYESIDMNAIDEILEKFSLRPKYLYSLLDDKNKSLTDKHVFTGIADLNIEDDLIVFETFSSQIYYLYDGSGNFLEGPCHDLELGHGGLIMLRYSGGDPGFQLKNRYDPSFHKDGDTIPFNHFPYTRGISFLDNMEEDYFKDPRIDKNRKNDRDYIMQVVKMNGWSLQFASPELRNDEEIVVEACKMNTGAFLFASDRLKQDKEFVAELLSNTSAHVYAYLDREMQDSADILKTMEILEAAQKEKEKGEKGNERDLPF